MSTIKQPTIKQPTISPNRDKRANTQQPNNNGAVQNLAGQFQDEANNAGLAGGSLKFKKLNCGCSSLKGGKKIKRKTNKRKTNKRKTNKRKTNNKKSKKRRNLKR